MIVLIIFLVIGLAVGLTFMPVKTKTIEPTCVEDGITYKTDIWKVQHKREKVLPALGHDPEITIQEKQATCTEDGNTAEIKCKRCGEVLSEYVVVPALGHQFEEGLCIRCDAPNEDRVTDVALQYDGVATTTVNYELFGDNETAWLVINGDSIEDQSKSKFSVSWQVEEPGIEIALRGGIFQITMEGSYVIGTVHGKLLIRGTNTVSLDVTFNISSGDTAQLVSLSALGAGDTASYVDGQPIDKSTIKVWGDYRVGDENVLVRILAYECNEDRAEQGLSELEISYGGQMVAYPISVRQKTLQYIEIERGANKTRYVEGEAFDVTGLKIRAYYEYMDESVDDYEVETDAYLREGETYVRISYTYGGVTKYIDQMVTVGPRQLLSLRIDDSAVRKQYTVGDYFEPAGLIVKATFIALGEIEVTDYQYNTGRLTANDTSISISYSVGGVSKRCSIPVSVKSAYEQKCLLRTLTPADVVITWSYRYQKDGKDMIDNTTYEENNLRYDRVNGLYEIPVGAVVTATVRNPAMIDVAIDGKLCSMDYVEKSVSWQITASDDVEVSLKEMAGAHSVIRFSGEGIDQFFLYDGSWNGQLNADNLLRLQTIFSDNDHYYYTYFSAGETSRFADLSEDYFVKGMTIVVAKNALSDTAKQVLLHLDDGVTYAIRVPVEEAETWIIPEFTRAGYYFKGWSALEGGAIVAQDALVALLQSDATSVDLYVAWEEEVVDYSNVYLHEFDGALSVCQGKLDDSDVQLAGSWHVVGSFESEQIECALTLNADGTFLYSISYNGIPNCKYNGKYRLSGNSIIVISSVPALDNTPYLNGSDFGLAFDEGFTCNLIVILDEQINIGSCLLSRES